MQMNKQLVGVFLAAVVAAAGCTGSQGDRGPAGAAGATGATGPQGPAGSGENSLVKTTTLNSGDAHCPAGGLQIDTGLDANNNGTLDAGEIAATKYVCNGSAGTNGTNGSNGSNGSNGTNGANALSTSTVEPAGANCASGGTKVQVGLDTNADGTLQAGEVTGTYYVCNGAGGLNGASAVSTGVNISNIAVSTGSPVTVTFTMKDDKGYPVDVNGVYSVNTVFNGTGTNSLIRFGLMYTTLDANNNVLPYTVYTKSGTTPSPTVYNPATAGGSQGALAEVTPGSGNYRYTFPTTSLASGAKAVAIDPAHVNDTHTLWIQVARQMDTGDTDDRQTFFAKDVSYDFIPSGTGTPLKREVVSTAACYTCHQGFKDHPSDAFHSGSRVDARYCNVCHNPGRQNSDGSPNTAARSDVFVHRIHNGEMLQPANLFHGIAATYPQDVRNCNACHAGAAQGAQAQGKPTMLACGSCHDYVNFSATTLGTTCGINGTLARDANGVPLPCDHLAGPQADDTGCVGCHSVVQINGYHVPVATPATDSIYVGGSNANTNAAFMAGAGSQPTGALYVQYVVNAVDTIPDTAAGGLLRPRISFKLQTKTSAAGTWSDVVFADPGSATQMMPNFVGGPSVYFVWSVPQDGVTVPVDFNASASAYLRNIWNGVGDYTTSGTWAVGTQGGVSCAPPNAACTCTTAAPCYVPKGTITGPTGTYYTVVLNTVRVPAGAGMLTGGVGYTYSLGSATSTPPFVGNSQPLTQTNVAKYPYTANACVGAPAGAYCGGKGGLIMPAQDVSKVATGYSARRAIVKNFDTTNYAYTTGCNACHAPLGVEPNFHAGQRNDGPTCAWCHNANQRNAGWAGNAKDIMHGIHGGGKRTVPFAWHATCPTGNVTCTTANGSGFWDVEFPAATNTCQACHLPGMYDFSSTVYTDAVMAAMLPSYAASGALTTYGAIPPPYVDGSGATNYGAAFAYNATTGATTTAGAANLYKTPITAACSGCHDSIVAVDHMINMGGSFYAVRGANANIYPTVPSQTGPQVEQCLLCHGPGGVVAITDMHK